MSGDNWNVCERECLIAFGDHALPRLERLAEGDHVWVYVNRHYADRQLPKVEELRALITVTGPIQRIERSPWKPRGAVTFHVARPIHIERRASAPAKETLKRLSFAGRPPVWGMRLLAAPLRLTGADVAKLEALLI